MFSFWLLALVMAAVAALFVVAPLLIKRNAGGDDVREAINVALFRERVEELTLMRDGDEISEDEFSALETDARKDLLSDAAGVKAAEQGSTTLSKLLIGTAVLVPLVAVVLYADFGLSRGAIYDQILTDRFSSTAPDDPDFRKLVAEFEAYTETADNKTDAQFILARAYLNLGEYEKGAALYGELAAAFPNDAALAAYHAEALFVAAGRQISPEVRTAVDLALSLNPEDISMMEVNAIGAIQAGDAEAALSWFHRVLATGVTGRRADIIRAAMREIRTRMGEPGASARESAPVVSETGSTGRVIMVEVSADADVNLPDSSAVFVFARAASGPPAPLAVQRLTLAELPATIRLDESMAMIQGMGLANFDSVVVIARASASGGVTASPGDYEAKSEALDLTGEIAPLQLQISEQLK